METMLPMTSQRMLKEQKMPRRVSLFGILGDIFESQLKYAEPQCSKMAIMIRKFWL